MKSRLPVVGIMGSGKTSHSVRSEQLGRWLAEKKVHLLTGGGGGVMAAVSKAFHETADRAGHVIGILPSRNDATRPRPGYPNRWVEIPIFTHLPHSSTQGTDLLSRNHINVLTSDIIVALPGGAGTASEVKLALAYERPVIAFLEDKDEIPGIDSQVPIKNSFSEVCDFIRSTLEI